MEKILAECWIITKLGKSLHKSHWLLWKVVPRIEWGEGGTILLEDKEEQMTSLEETWKNVEDQLKTLNGIHNGLCDFL